MNDEAQDSKRPRQDQDLYSRGRRRINSMIKNS